MNITTQLSNTTKVHKTFVLFTALLFINACSESSTLDSEQTSLESNTLSGNVIDASKLTLLQKSAPNSASATASKVDNSTGSFTYPSTEAEFSGNISVAFNVGDEDGIKQVYIGFTGSDLTLPICQEDCGTEYSAFVNGINPSLFGLSGSEQNITLWVEDNDNDLSQVTSLSLSWRELAISGVTVTLDSSTEELSVSWNALTGMLRYNVYISNDENLTGQNYIDLDGGEAKLALTDTSTVFTEKPINDIYYILVSGVDGSGESAFSDKIMLVDGAASIVTENSAPRFADNDGHIVTVNENSPEGTVVYTPSVYDPDDDAELTYSLSNGHGVFQMHSKTGAVYVNNQGLLDYETQPHNYELNMTVTDETSLSDSLSITVKVNDVIENSEFVLDTSFSGNGISHFNTYADTEYADYLVDAQIDSNNNRYLLSYSDKSTDEEGNNLKGNVFTVSKIKPDGTFDLAFGNNGKKKLQFDSLNDPNVESFLDPGPINAFRPTKLKIDDTNNKIYVLGYQNYSGGTDTPFVVRLGNNGTIDSSFSDDGKYEYLGANSGDNSEAVDLVIHSNGSLYLASSTRPETESQSQVTQPEANLKLVKLSNSGAIQDSHNYNLISADVGVYVIGLVENTAGNLVAFGYVNNDDDTNLMALEILISDLTNETALEFSFDSVVLTDTISTYKQIDGDTILLGGSTGSESVIAKLIISTIADDPTSFPALDTTFGDPDELITPTQKLGFYIDDTASGNANVVSLDVDLNGDITYISRAATGSYYKLIPSQLAENGTVTSLGEDLRLQELTGTSGAGIDDANIHAVVLFDNADSTNTINIFSSVEKQNNNTAEITAEYNTELSIYYQQVDPTALPTELAAETDRIDYEFQTIKTLNTNSSFIHSSGAILSSTEYDSAAQSAQSITSHNLITGLLNQTFGDTLTPSYINTIDDSTNNVHFSAAGIIEINETDTNGINYFISAESINEDSGDISIRVDKLDVNGQSATGFPIYNDLSISDTPQLVDIAYNTKANLVALFGSYDDNPLLITINPSTGAVTENLFDNVNGLTVNESTLTSGVIQDDGSIIVLGTMLMGDGQEIRYYDTFLMKVNSDGEVDIDFDDAAGDLADDSIITVETVSDTNVESGKLVQLSDGSIAYYANDLKYGEAFLVKLINTKNGQSLNHQEYKLDTSFDDATTSENSNATEGVITLNMSGLASDSNQPTIKINDLALNRNDELVFVGYADFESSKASFIAEFNGLNGSPSETLGSNSLAGYFIPYGRSDCSTAANLASEIGLCDIDTYEKISIADNGSIIIHATKANAPENSTNSVILKFKEYQNDTAVSYNMPSTAP